MSFCSTELVVIRYLDDKANMNVTVFKRLKSVSRNRYVQITELKAYKDLIQYIWEGEGKMIQYIWEEERKKSS